MTDLDHLTAEERLRAFAQEILECWPDIGGFDPMDIQELAEKHGLLEPHEVTKPCADEGCNCAEYGEWPIQCYRKTALLTGETK